MNKSNTIKCAWKVIEIAKRVIEISKRMAIETRGSFGYTVENHLEEISIYNYSEPGYDKDQLVALGNWNEITKYNKATNTREVISNLPCIIASVFEKMSIECEWSDEWASCNDCGRIVRTQADSYSWTPSFHIFNDCCELVCHKCIKEDPEEYFSDLEGKCNVANTIDLDPCDYGYVKINDEPKESGWYPGQNDNPSDIAKELENKGISRFLFSIDSVGQFDTKWNVYVHEDEKELLNPIEEDNFSEVLSEVKSVCPQCKECKGTGILIFEFYTRKCGCMLR